MNNIWIFHANLWIFQNRWDIPGLCLSGRRSEVQIRVHRVLGLSTASRVVLMSFEGDNVQKVKLWGCKIDKFYIPGKCRDLGYLEVDREPYCERLKKIWFQ